MVGNSLNILQFTHLTIYINHGNLSHERLTFGYLYLIKYYINKNKPSLKQNVDRRQCRRLYQTREPFLLKLNFTSQNTKIFNNRTNVQLPRALNLHSALNKIKNVRNVQSLIGDSVPFSVLCQQLSNVSTDQRYDII